MPLYEYQCEKCGKKFEITQRMSDNPIENCPEENCGGKVKKLLFASGIVFKGSGFYLTDYSDKMKKKDKPSEDSESPKPSPCQSAEGCPAAGGCDNTGK